MVSEAYGSSSNKSIGIIRDWIKNEGAEQAYNKTIQMVNRNEFKRRQAAIGIKFSKVAFGSGRRYPVTKK